MSAESHVFSALKDLVDDRVYPDVAPPGVQEPYIVYQCVGGKATNFLGGETPSKTNARVQVSVWSLSRLQTSALVKQVEQAMRASAALQTTVLGSAVSDHEPETQRFGARQDFSVWTA